MFLDDTLMKVHGDGDRDRDRTAVVGGFGGNELGRRREGTRLRARSARERNP